GPGKPRSPGQFTVNTRRKFPWLVLISDRFDDEETWVTRVRSAVPWVPTKGANRPVAFAAGKGKREVVEVVGARSECGPVRSSVSAPPCFGAIRVIVPRSGNAITSTKLELRPPSRRNRPIAEPRVEPCSLACSLLVSIPCWTTVVTWPRT